MAKKKSDRTIQEYLNDLWEPSEFMATIERIFGNYNTIQAHGWLTAQLLRDSNDIHDAINKAGRISDYQRYIAQEVDIWIGSI